MIKDEEFRRSAIPGLKCVIDQDRSSYAAATNNSQIIVVKTQM